MALIMKSNFAFPKTNSLYKYSAICVFGHVNNILKYKTHKSFTSDNCNFIIFMA